jgi:hypothetical protein
LLKLTTILLRLLLPVVVLAVWTPVANAWSWPIQGPVVRPFSFDEAHPYAAGQHRGIDIGADAAGEVVAAPAGGTVSFAGTVPTNGKSVTIETTDGYAVTLTHLGSIGVAKGATVAERDPVGTVGPSGTPEEAGPYVHLGIRVATDPNGYVDPVDLLPASAESGATPDDPAASQPTSSGSSSTAPATVPTGSGGASTTSTDEPAAPAASTPRPATTRGSTVAPGHGHGGAQVHEHEHTRDSRARSGRGSESGEADARTASRATKQPRRVSMPTRSSRRPVVETAAPHEPTGLDAGHEIRPSAQAAQPRRAPGAGELLQLILNGAAALVALAAAAAAGRRRSCPGSFEGAQVVQLPRPALERRAA